MKRRKIAAKWLARIANKVSEDCLDYRWTDWEFKQDAKKMLRELDREAIAKGRREALVEVAKVECETCAKGDSL